MVILKLIFIQEECVSNQVNFFMKLMEIRIFRRQMQLSLNTMDEYIPVIIR